MTSIKKYVLVGLLLLVCLQRGESALNQAADNDIKNAIRSAIEDGLNTIDSVMRAEYWYYLRGSQRLAFNVTVKPSSINFVIIFRGHSSLYRVNCDLIKTTWQARLNSFVEVVSYNTSFASLTSYTTQDNQAASIVDLTHTITSSASLNSTQTVPTLPKTTSSAKNESRKATASPIIVLTPTAGGSLTVNPPHH